MTKMQPFPTARDAKEFLVGRITAEAQRQGAPLSEIERKMLYFSETDWTLPDIREVANVFDRDYDMAEYEERIGKIIRTMFRNDRRENRDGSSWKKALETLRTEDHYLLVLIANATSTLPNRLDCSLRSNGNRIIKLLLIGFLLACVVLALGYLFLPLR